MNRAGLLIDWHLFSELAQDRKEPPAVRAFAKAVAERAQALLAAETRP